MLEGNDEPDDTKASESDASDESGHASSDQRGSPRFTLLIRAAKLVVDGREFLCILRDASATGLKVRLFTPLPEHRDLRIELANGDRYPIELVWHSDDYAGFRFQEEVEIERLLDESHGGFPRRQVRLRIALNAMLHSGGEAVRIAFNDISQQGAGIECDKWLLMNELVKIETGVMPAIYAKVRWRSHPRYGLVFEQTFKLDELARISAPLQLGQAIRDAEAGKDSEAGARATG
ncbi:PilZ domain-containing protein [Novosphingobium sp. KCTC 2891]|uniref:PilZ domain-containing protein n=1 Tax=Novosphingobium sp. KCTC 2891 TaxID=2989730 RepID=UPI00222199D0|nr:PilZ domain-containing protein [Novosphingobium sp. KCTC 2891]MCW1382211.1 PilZ domain-containing protein [Novosphingobium sp. KCTC 2891]